MKTACCQYQCKDDDFGPVFTNTGNNVVQCHNCGEVYVPGSELAALREANRWIPVGERLPKKLGNVEIWRKMKDGTLVPGVAFVIAGSGWWVDTSGGRWAPGEVTHWRPMPAPPEPQAVQEVEP